MKTLVRTLCIFILTFLIGCDKRSEDPIFDSDTKILESPSNRTEFLNEAHELELSELYTNLRRLQKRAQSKGTNATPAAKSKHINVPGDFGTIQEAVDAAQPGAIIKINGSFSESVVIQGKNNLTLIGINSASVSSTDETILVNLSQGIEIKDLSIEGYISILSSTHCTVKNNEISGGLFGVFLEGSSGCDIKDNNIQNIQGEFFGVGHGIVGINSDENQITGNIISEARVGIELIFGSDFNTVKDNVTSNTGNFGISFVINCNQNSVKNNNITNAAWSGFNLVANSNGNSVRDLWVSGSNGPAPPGFNIAGVGIFDSGENDLRNVNSTANENGTVLTGISTGNLFINLEVNQNSTFGLRFDPATDSNTVKDSSGSDNGICDLSDEGAGNQILNSEFNVVCN